MEEIIRLCLGEITKSGKDESLAREILSAILESKGSRLDYLTIAERIGVSHITVKDYLNVLERGRLIYVLHAWDVSKKAHAIGRQKKIIFQNPFASYITS